LRCRGHPPGQRLHRELRDRRRGPRCHGRDVEGRKPSSRHRSGGRGRDDGWNELRAAELVARQYGWNAEYLDTRVTDEQLVAYVDAYNDRLEDEATAAFHTAVEAQRAGAIFARRENDRQYQAWRRKTARATEKIGLTGKALESAIMGFAAMH